MKRGLIALAFAVAAASGLAAVTMTNAPGGWQLMSGSANVGAAHGTQTLCEAAAKVRALADLSRSKPEAKYRCVHTVNIGAKWTPDPVVPPVVVPPVVTPPVTPADPHNGGIQPGDLPRYNVASIPAPARGSGTYDVRPTRDVPYPEEIGAFRTRCEMSHFNRDDSLIYPGAVGAAHLHMYWGNTGSNAKSTAESIRTTGNSTCRGGIANRSTYWAPALIDTASGNVLRMMYADVYYKTGYLGVKDADVKPIPQGLRIIAGDASRTSAPPQDTFFRFACGGRHGSTIPAGCTSGVVEVSIAFPQCWDGVNLSSPDNKSHMKYASKGCPASHPVPLPEIAYIMHFDIPAGSNTSNWRLASDNYRGGPGGYSMHADWINGWDPKLPPIWTTLIINRKLSGGSHMLGDGTEMY